VGDPLVCDGEVGVPGYLVLRLILEALAQGPDGEVVP
jgi:hypothetical protein